MHELLHKLTGGDRRSIGRVDEVIAAVRQDPALFAVLIDGMEADDPLVRMRSADAIEKLTVDHPDWLCPHKDRILNDISAVSQQEVRWHLAQILPRLSLTAAERRQAVELLKSYLSDGSAIVRTFSLQALADLAERDASLLPEVTALLEERLQSGSKAEQSRARKLLWG
jgi:HEAT repeat protein